MSAFSETQNRAHITWTLWVSIQIFLPKQMKQNVIITNKNCKFMLNDELLSDIRLKKISKLHGIVV